MRFRKTAVFVESLRLQPLFVCANFNLVNAAASGDIDDLLYYLFPDSFPPVILLQNEFLYFQDFCIVMQKQIHIQAYKSAGKTAAYYHKIADVLI